MVTPFKLYASSYVVTWYTCQFFVSWLQNYSVSTTVIGGRMFSGMNPFSGENLRIERC